MENNKELREYIQENYYKLNDSAKRIYPENHEKRARNDYQRDYSRILYAPSFRRLQGKMQLFGIQHDKIYRNRLTHSLEVSQISRSIADKLRNDTGLADMYLDDMYVLEACALAHDLGNPPFGHYGERVLNSIARDFGGFEGNAQTLKVLMMLEKKLPEHGGLNLTLRTLMGVIKYFNRHEGNEDGKFLYDQEYDIIESALASDAKGVSLRTLDVQIIDLADEIAYAADDLEDALEMKLFNIDEFMYEYTNYMRHGNPKRRYGYEILEDAVREARDVASQSSTYSSSEEFGLMFRKELTSNLVNVLLNDITLKKASDEFKAGTGTMNDYELGFKDLGHFIGGLKKVTSECINRLNSVQLYEKQGEKVIKGLYEVFMNESFNKEDKLLPVEFRKANSKFSLDERNKYESRERLIVDYIAGMMDGHAMDLYGKFYGKGELEKLYSREYFSK